MYIYSVLLPKPLMHCVHWYIGWYCEKIIFEANIQVGNDGLMDCHQVNEDIVWTE